MIIDSRERRWWQKAASLTRFVTARFPPQLLCYATSEGGLDHTDTGRLAHCKQRHRAANAVANHETVALVDSTAVLSIPVPKTGNQTVAPGANKALPVAFVCAAQWPLYMWTTQDAAPLVDYSAKGSIESPRYLPRYLPIMSAWATHPARRVPPT